MQKGFAMKLIKIGDETAYYIGRIKDKILVIIDNINPLEYPYEFGEALYNLSQNIPKSKIPIYIDFTKWKGYPKVVKLMYLKDKDNIDVYSSEEVSFNSISEDIKKTINEFHKLCLTKME